MFLKRLIGLVVFAGALAFSAAGADIVVRIAPPQCCKREASAAAQP